ncbi:MAG: hypothetical protein L3J46_07155, partial [Kangiellaceae bacterium]|nr:hypothetical protein [Kangiellaceae bacterium]
MHLLIDWGNSRLKYILVETLSSQSVLSECIQIQFAESVRNLRQRLKQKDTDLSINKVLSASGKSDVK